MQILSPLFIVLVIISLAVVVGLFFLPGKNKDNAKASVLSILSLVFIVLSLFFAKIMVISYILIVLSIVLAIIDLVNRNQSDT